MLYLVGVGLSNGDISLKAQEACRRSELFFERYTCAMEASRIEPLERLFGRKILPLGRHDLEEDAKVILEHAKKGDVAVLIGGDPLIATTHKALLSRAKKFGVSVGIVHAVSVFSVAIGESGLDFYRFGKVCTLAGWKEHYRPVSFYETIRLNIQNNEHALVLLDYDAGLESSLPLSDVVKELRAAEEVYKSGIITDSTPVMVLNRLSQEGELKAFVKFGELEALKINKGPTAIIIPAKLTGIEEETLKSIFS